MIALMQLLIKYALLEPFGAHTSLDALGILLLVTATICIAAAGNILNDINDFDTDLINKPKKVIVKNKISEKTAYNLFIALNLIGVGLGFYVSYKIGKSAFASLFVITSFLLYLYATYLKRTILVGNIIVSVLVALSVFVVGIFELIPNTEAYNQSMQLVFFKMIWDYSLFAFSINLLREIVKDIEDIPGDSKTGIHTLAVAFGETNTKNLLCVLNFIPLIGIIYYVSERFYKYPIAVVYFLLLVVGPLIYTSIKTFSATTKKDFHHISSLYKIIMLLGMLSLLLYKYVILK